MDSGSAVSLIDYHWYLEFGHLCRLSAVRPSLRRCRSINGEQLPLIGEVRGSLSIGRFSWPVCLLVVKQLPVTLLLGCDFISRTGLVLDVSGNALFFKFAPAYKIGLCSCRASLRGNFVCASSSNFQIEHLERNQQEQLGNLLQQFPKVLCDELGVTDLIEYHIRLVDDIPVRQAPYRLSPPKMRILREKINDMLEKGVIRPSTSAYASPIFLVPKDQGDDYRPVVDYRRLNSKVVLESIPLPDLHNCFTWFSGAEWFTVLDLNQAYYQIPLAEQSKHVTAVCTDWNLYEFNRVPFGLATGAAVLSRLLDRVLGDLKFACVYNYLDDVVIYSRTFGEHLVHLREVLSRLQTAGLTVKPTKVTLAKRQISFLGHLVSSNGIRIDQDRTKDIKEFPRPRSKKEIARFIGMANYFRKFVPNFAQLAAPLNTLRKKKEEFVWGDTQQSAFEAIKTAITNPPVLAVPNFDNRFIVQTDASNAGVAAVLLQEEEGGERRPVAFASRRLAGPETKYSVYECEALAVLFALEKFKFYLEHREFDLETDNQALSWVLARPRKTGRIARWAVRISAFRFKVRHIRGIDNQIADALSRMFDGEQPPSEEPDAHDLPMVASVLSEVPQLFADLKLKQDEDPLWGPIRKRLVCEGDLPPYFLREGVLCKEVGKTGEKKICLPTELVPAIFHYYHNSVVGGHLGIYKTLEKVRAHLTWPSLYKDIRQMVNQCESCKRAKPNSSRDKGLLQSQREENPMDKIFIDYLGPLPRTQRGNRYVLVVVDAFTRYIWLIPSRGITATITAQHLTNIFSWFGPPRSLVSDNAPAFVSTYFKQFCFRNGIRHITTTPYYPQGSFAERVNRNLKGALIIYHSRSPTKWDASLPWLNLAFNSAQHESSGAVPSSLMLAYPPNSPLSNLWNINDLLPSSITPNRLKENWERARRNIQLAHRRQARRFNHGRRPFPGKVGDKVFIQKFERHGGQVQGRGKLAPRFVGPCVILRVLGPVNLLVKDPTTGKTFRVHTSQVKLGN